MDFLRDWGLSCIPRIRHETDGEVRLATYDAASSPRKLFDQIVASVAQGLPVRGVERVTDKTVSKSWEAHWQELAPFFDFPSEIRKIIYTTNAIESLNSSFRKISRHRNLFSSVNSLFKLFYLSLKNISIKWTLTVPNWPGALSHFAIEFEDRMPNRN